MSQKWNDRFLAIAQFIGTWSKDPHTQVGAILVDTKKRIIGMGYNGFPRKVEDSLERYNNKELKRHMVVHAEVNAILNATGSVLGSTLYSTLFPCPTCAGMLIQSGVSQIVSSAHTADGKYCERHEISKQMFHEAGISYSHFTQE